VKLSNDTARAIHHGEVNALRRDCDDLVSHRAVADVTEPSRATAVVPSRATFVGIGGS
jgi:hypothetical protein